jgi:hypothetical protein
MFPPGTKAFGSKEYFKLGERSAGHTIFHVKYARVDEIRTQDLLPRAYLPYHLTYTLVMVEKEMLSF